MTRQDKTRQDTGRARGHGRVQDREHARAGQDRTGTGQDRTVHRTGNREQDSGKDRGQDEGQDTTDTTDDRAEQETVQGTGRDRTGQGIDSARPMSRHTTLKSKSP